MRESVTHFEDIFREDRLFWIFPGRYVSLLQLSDSLYLQHEDMHEKHPEEQIGAIQYWIYFYEAIRSVYRSQKQRMEEYLEKLDEMMDQDHLKQMR